MCIYIYIYIHIHIYVYIYIYIFAGPCAQGVLDKQNKEINPSSPSPNPLPQGGLGAQSR